MMNMRLFATATLFLWVSLYCSDFTITNQNSKSDWIEDFLLDKSYAQHTINQITQHISKQYNPLGDRFQEICKQSDVIDTKFLETYITKEYTLESFFKKNEPSYALKNILAPLVLHDLYNEKELPNNVHQLFRNLQNSETSKELTYINAYKITFGSYTKNTVYTEKYDEYQKRLDEKDLREKEKYEKRENLIRKKKEQKNLKIKNSINPTPISIISITQQPNTNQSHVQKKIQEPLVRSSETALDNLENIKRDIAKHLNINEEEKVIFAVDDKDLSTQNEIFKYYENNKYNVNVLIDFAKKNKDTQNIKNILAPLLLYEIINGRLEKMDHQAKLSIVQMYDPNKNNNIELKPHDNDDVLYKLIYNQCEYAGQIKKLKCRYNIVLCNTNEALLDYEDPLVFLQDIATCDLGNCVKNLDWLDIKLIKNIKSYLDNLSKMKNCDAAKEKMYNIFIEHQNLILKNQTSIRDYFEYIKLFFTLPNYQNNHDILKETYHRGLVEYLGTEQENIKHFLEHSKNKYPYFFAQLFVRKFNFAWFSEKKESQLFWLEHLQYFNTLNCTQKRTVPGKMVVDFFSNIDFIPQLSKNQREDLTKFIETNIEYKGEPIEYIDVFEDHLDKSFVKACIEVKFINKDVSFRRTAIIENINNNNNQNNIEIITDNNTPNDNTQRAINASWQTLNNTVHFDDDLILAIQQSLASKNNSDNFSHDGDDFIKNAVNLYFENNNKDDLASSLCSFIPCSNQIENIFSMTDDGTYENLCTIFELNIKSSYIDLRRAAIKIARQDDIGKIYADLIVFDSNQYDKQLHDIDLLYCALENCKNNEIYVLASKINAFYAQFSNIILEPQLDLIYIADLDTISEDTLNFLKNAGIIDPNVIKIENNPPNPDDGPSSPDDSSSSDNEPPQPENQNQGNLKKPWYQNKYLRAGLGLSGLGLLVYLILKDHPKFIQNILGLIKQA